MSEAEVYRKSGAWVPWMVVGILSISVVANMILLLRATADPAFAVEPDYYAKAVHWDQIRAEQEASLRLGWSVDLKLEPEHALLRLSDRMGRPIENAQVTADAFAMVRSQHFVEAPFEELGNGRYRWTYAFPHRGRWEFRLEITHDEDRFVSTIRGDVP